MRLQYLVLTAIAALAASSAAAAPPCVYDRAAGAFRAATPADADLVKAETADWLPLAYDTKPVIAGKTYGRYALAREFTLEDLKTLRYAADIKGAPMFFWTEAKDSAVIYIPVNLNKCEFQPFAAGF